MTNAIVKVGDNNAANSIETIDHARIMGNNMRTERNRVRQLARSFVLAAVDDNYQLEGLIEDAREAMKWGKLDKSEKNRANVLFSTLRTIVGAWPKLTPETQDLFRKGSLIYSTLADSIKDARKAAEKAEAEAEQQGEEQAQAQEQSEQQAQAQPQAGDPVVQSMRDVALWVDETALADMSPEQLVALRNLADALDDFRAKVAAPAKVSKAA